MKIEFLKPSDVSFDANSLKEFILSENKKLFEVSLGFKNFQKNPDRFETFVKKVREDLPFEDSEGKQIVLDKSQVFSNSETLLNKLEIILQIGMTEENVKQVFGVNPSKIKFRVLTVDGQPPEKEYYVSIGKLKKTGDFGGEPSGKRTKKEKLALGQLDEVIKKAIDDNGGNPINITFKLEDGTYINTYNGIVGVKGADSEQPFKKADFILFSQDANKIYVSHKDGTLPADFQQWSGITLKSGEEIYTHPEITDFIETLKKTPTAVEKRGDEYFMKPKITVGRKIKDNQLKLFAIFGSEYSDSGEGSLENVDIVAQGLFKLDKVSDGTYELSATHLLSRKGFKGNFGKGYEPILVARKGDRNTSGIQNCRAVIYPEKGRTIQLMI